jgi:preprotein translocase subunit SecG
MFLNISLTNWLLILQGVCLVASIVLILIQQRGASIGSAFGGSSADVYLTKRGIEKSVVNATVIFIALFIILRVTSLFF